MRRVTIAFSLTCCTLMVYGQAAPQISKRLSGQISYTQANDAAARANLASAETDSERAYFTDMVTKTSAALSQAMADGKAACGSSYVPANQAGKWVCTPK